MDRVESWLRAAGLAHRAKAFLAHGVDEVLLPTLTDAELRELGLTIGERRRMRAAFAATPFTEPAAAHPERRPLTAVFVDLVGSTALAERLDADDLLDLIRRYRALCAEIVGRYGGRVAEFVGDGVVAHFSYPIASEDDPERAIRASLDIARAVDGLTPPRGGPAVRARVGVATGQAVVGGIAGAAAGVDRDAALGPTLNLAARLQGLAPPGGVVIAETTFARVRGAFECEELGPQHLRGFAEARAVYRVLHERAAGARMRRAAGPAFVGRGAESAALATAWDSARAGRGRAVIVAGEAGIGKSRLVARFIETRLADRGVAHLVHLCASSLDRDTPLHPLLEHLRAAARLDANEALEAQMERLAAATGGGGATRVLADLLGLADDPALRRLAPAAQRARVLAAASGYLLSLATQGTPLCLVVEDVHWLDPTSRELLKRLATTLSDRPVLALLTTREDGDAEAAAALGVDVIALGPLGGGEVAAMLEGFAGERPLPPQVCDAIFRRTDGVPLFVEEVARTLLSPTGGGLSNPPEEDEVADVPASLREALVGRLDRTGRARHVAQAASVFGRSVRRDLLAAAAAVPADDLAAHLAALCDAGVLRAEPAAAAAAAAEADRYAFTHVLVRDAAYDTLMRESRRTLHGRAAAALLRLPLDAAERRPELLAMHLAEAGKAAEAVPHWVAAARRNLDRSALQEAARLLRRGLATLGEAAVDDAARRERRLEMLALLGPATAALHGPRSDRTQGVYDEAFELARASPDSAAHFPIFWNWWFISPDFHTQKTRAEALWRHAGIQRDAALKLQAHHCNWASRFNDGDLCGCIRHIDAGLAIYDCGEYRGHAALYGNHDARVCALGNRAQVSWHCGRPLAALGDEAAALRWARELGHAGSVAHATDMAALHRVFRGDPAEVAASADKLLALAAESGLTGHRPKSLIFRGWAVAMGGDAARGLAMLREGLSEQCAVGGAEEFGIHCCLLADAVIAAGSPDRAIEELAAGRDLLLRTGYRIWLPEVHRTLGEAILLADPGACVAAEAAFTEAVAEAGRQGAAMLALRATLSWARLAARLGRHDEAAARLDTARAAVPEAADSADGRAAAALAVALVERRPRPVPAGGAPRAVRAGPAGGAA